MAKNTPEVEETEVTAKQVINEGIDKVLEAAGDGTQHQRYKAMRAIAFQAFVESIENGDFNALVKRAIKNINDLPSGWEIAREPKSEKVAAEKPAKAAKAAPAKATAKSSKATAEKTPARKPRR